MNGLEPSTFSLEGCEHPSQGTEEQGLADTAPDACTAACTSDPDSVHSEAADGDFTEAPVMIARLSLSDSERAEAVRRLMASREG